jgi:predicted lipoprotein with Yx(FWY)xxD motif
MLKMRTTLLNMSTVLAVALALATPLAAKSPTLGVLATPPGITLQVLGNAQGYDLGKQTAAAIPRDEIAFTNLKGLTLYTNDKDAPGMATCDRDCAQTWLPMLASTQAHPLGPWSLIARPDGSKQWAYSGKALYHYVKDVDPGSVWGNSPARFGARRKNGAGEYVGGGERGEGIHGPRANLPPVKGWHIALAYPVDSLDTPAGISIKEVPDALGLTLVDWRGHTLYAFDGAPSQEKSLSAAWRPAAAAQLAEANGDFSVVVRKDGIKQWAYKARPLYAFDGDLEPGDANGMGEKNLTPAAVYRYFVPSNVTVVDTSGQGRIFATASGQTLYRRDGYIFQSGGGHSLHRGQPARPAVGRDIGINAHCAHDCDRWHPFLAPANAQPQGFWDVAKRGDGSSQWVYQGYALWTYDGDTKPGDINGNDAYDINFAGSPTMKSDASQLAQLDVGTPMDGTPGLYWAIVNP